MKHLSVSKIFSLTDEQCSAALAPFDQECARRLGNDPRAVLLRRARGGPGDSAIVLADGDHDASRGPWTRAAYDEVSRSLGNDPVIAAARFEARGGTFVGDPEEESDDGDDDEPLAAVDSNEEPLVCSDDGAKRRALGRIKMGSQLHHGQAQPFVRDPPVVVGRPRRT